MEVTRCSVRRISLGVLAMSASVVLASSLAGCGYSSSSGTLTPEAKKTLDAQKVGAPNPFVKSKTSGSKGSTSSAKGPAASPKGPGGRRD